MFLFEVLYADDLKQQKSFTMIHEGTRELIHSVCQSSHTIWHKGV